MRLYRLNGRTAEPCSWDEWVEAQEARGRITGEFWRDEGDPHRVAFTDINNEVSVSTIFLGVDHNYFGDRPLLFETMVFSNIDEIEGWMKRCSTWEEAEAQHAEAVTLVRRSLIKIVGH